MANPPSSLILCFICLKNIVLVEQQREIKLKYLLDTCQPICNIWRHTWRSPTIDPAAQQELTKSLVIIWGFLSCSDSPPAFLLFFITSSFITLVHPFSSFDYSLPPLSLSPPPLSPHLSLLCHITHPDWMSLPISPSLTPALSFFLSSHHHVALTALFASPSSIILPSWLLSPFLFHSISSIPRQLFTISLVSRMAMSVSDTNTHVHTVWK